MSKKSKKQKVNGEYNILANDTGGYSVSFTPADDFVGYASYGLSEVVPREQWAEYICQDLTTPELLAEVSRRAKKISEATGGKALFSQRYGYK